MKGTICDLDPIPVDQHMHDKSWYILWGIYMIVDFPTAPSWPPLRDKSWNSNCENYGLSQTVNPNNWKTTAGKSNPDKN